MNSCFIILAGGESKRFNSNIPKPYTNYKGKPLLLHSIDKAKVFNKFNKIVLVVNKKHKNYIKKLNIKNIKIITGGKTRAESAYNALRSIKGNNFKNVIIHDAARPNFSLKLLTFESSSNALSLIASTDSSSLSIFLSICSIKKLIPHPCLHMLSSSRKCFLPKHLNCRSLRK